MQKINIKPLDVLFFRDSRPMEGSFRGVGDNIPLPHAFNGVVRSVLTDMENEKLRGSLLTAGPFFEYGGEVYFNAPQDLLLNGDGRVLYLEPRETKNEEAFLSNLPAGLSVISANGIRPTKKNLGRFISKAGFEKYLDKEELNASNFKNNSDFFSTENYIGIAIDPLTQTAADEKFYSKSTMRLNENARFTGLARFSRSLPENAYVKFGGEARCADFTSEEISSPFLPRCGKIGSTRIKFVLLTPAIYKTWRPDWIDENNNVRILDGPGAKKLERLGAKGVQAGKPIKARLVGAKIDRPIAISGYAAGGDKIQNRQDGFIMRKRDGIWQKEKDDKFYRGSKPLLFAVPAGSVYYLEAETPDDASKLADALNWHGERANPASQSAGGEIKNIRSLLGEKGYGIGVCGNWDYLK
ncbi:MAG: hypothetical protein J6P03_06375 [Opitutales bacterium]|nr:hypothetical protein [Opitutales bacterium]